MGTVYAGGSPNFDERTGQYKQPPAQYKPPATNTSGEYKQAYQTAKSPFNPAELMKNYGYANYGPVTQVPASTAPTPSNQTWTQAWNQSRQDFPTPSTGQYTPAVSYSAPGTHYRQQLRFDGQPQAAPVLMGNSDAGNYSYAQQGYRPDAFTQQATDFSGATSASPDYARRDAFISQLNDRLSRYQSGVSPISNAPPPSYDIRSMWDTAGKMVKSGWSNPYTQANPFATGK